jgi:hypothetical protein
VLGFGMEMCGNKTEVNVIIYLCISDDDDDDDDDDDEEEDEGKKRIRLTVMCDFICFILGMICPIFFLYLIG